MSESIVPSNRDLWDSVNQSRLELAELKGMIKMHFEDSKHHYPPCKPAADLQKTMLSSLAAALIALLAAVTMLSSLAAALIALLAAVGNIIMEFIRR